MKKLTNLFVLACLFVISTSANAIEIRQTRNWSWAACVQDVLLRRGVPYQSQARIAARLDGWAQNRHASIQEVVRLLQSYGVNAWQTGRPGTRRELFDTLEGGWKLIAFVYPPDESRRGRFVVLQGIDYRSSGIVVADPASGRTYVSSVRDLYYGWGWTDSVVVGF